MPKKIGEMTMDEYALHRGVSKMAISLALKDGRIVAREEMEGNRRRLYFDRLVCDAMWIADQGIKPGKPLPLAAAPQGRPTKAQKEALKTIHEALAAEGLPIPKPSYGAKSARNSGFLPHRSAQESFLQHGNTKVPPGDENSLQARAAVARVKKLEAEAAREQLDLEKEAKLLVDAETIEDLFAGMVADARDRFLSLGSAVKAAFPDIESAVIQFLNDTTMEILSTLGNIPERNALPVPERLEVEK